MKLEISTLWLLIAYAATLTVLIMSTIDMFRNYRYRKTMLENKHKLCQLLQKMHDNYYSNFKKFNKLIEEAETQKDWETATYANHTQAYWVGRTDSISVLAKKLKFTGAEQNDIIEREKYYEDLVNTAILNRKPDMSDLYNKVRD